MVTVVNGSGTSNRSQVPCSTHAWRAAEASGTTRARPSSPTTSAPGLALYAGPRGPSTANAASDPARTARTMPRKPRAPPLVDEPRTTRSPRRRITLACSSPSRDRLTSVVSGVLRRAATSAICCPCQKAYTARSRGGASIQCTRQVLAQMCTRTPNQLPSTRQSQRCSGAAATRSSTTHPIQEHPLLVGGQGFDGRVRGNAKRHGAIRNHALELQVYLCLRSDEQSGVVPREQWKRSTVPHGPSVTAAALRLEDVIDGTR